MVQNLISTELQAEDAAKVLRNLLATKNKPGFLLRLQTNDVASLLTSIDR